MLTRRPRSCSDEGSYTSGHHHHHRACSVYRSAVRRPAGASILPSASSLGSSCGLRGPAAPASSPYDTMRGAASSRASVHGRGGTERGGRRRARPGSDAPRSSAAVPAAPGTRTPATRTYKAASEAGSSVRSPPEHLVIASRFRRRLVCKCTGARRLHPPTPRRHGAARCEGIAERDASAARYPDPHRTGLVAVHLITCSGTRAPKTRSAMGDRPRPAEPRTTWLPAAARPDDGLPPHHHLHRHAELLRVRARSSRRRNSSCRAGGRDALPRVRTRVTTALTPLASTGKCHAIHQFACTVIPPHNS
jgi:hypothetical protein